MDLVKKWIDHSQKYGLVYIMNNGTMGILFNDNTKLLFKLYSEYVTPESNCLGSSYTSPSTPPARGSRSPSARSSSPPRRSRRR